jgi:predicted small metal-binding protein
MGRLSFACRSTGEVCEWALEADYADLILQRAAEHEKCAHHVPELSAEQRRRISDAIRAV